VDPIIIDDRNYRQYMRMMEEAGHKTGGLPRVVPFGGLPCAPAADGRIQVIPKAEIRDRIRAMDAAKAWPSDYIRREPKMQPRSQNGLNYCWAWCLAACADTLRLTQNLPYIESAPESLGGAVNYRNAGNDMTSGLSYAMEHGIAPRHDAAGNVLIPYYSLRPAQWDEDWKTRALAHRPTEAYDIGTWAEAISALLQGWMLYMGVAWWTHSLPGVRLVDNGTDDPDLEMWNSHGDGFIVLKESRKYPSAEYGIFAVRSQLLAA
jgi:hypothetical protein